MGPLQLRTRKGRAEGQLGQLSPENRHFVTDQPVTLMLPSTLVWQFLLVLPPSLQLCCHPKQVPRKGIGYRMDIWQHFNHP